MNIGFIGVGGVAQPHLQNLSKIPGVNIAAVCDVQEDRAKKAGETYGATPYTNYRTMIKKAGLDAVYVCVIPSAHANIELDLAKAGLPMYIEKPIHLSLTACKKVLDQLNDKSVINAVGYHWRYTKASQAVRQFVEGKKTMLVEGFWFGGFPQVGWWRQMGMSGGQLVEQTTHIVDMARYLAGEVHTVSAVGNTGAMTEWEHYDIHDSSIVTLQFDSGAIGQITTGCISDDPKGGHKVDITLKGKNWHAWTNAGQAKLAEAGNDDREVDSGQSWAEQLGNGDAAFVRAVQGNDQSQILSNYASGAQTLAITLAANKAIETHREQKVSRLV